MNFDDIDKKNEVEMDPLLKQLEHISNLSVENTSNFVDLNSINFQTQPQEIVLRIDGKENKQIEENTNEQKVTENSNPYINSPQQINNPYMNPHNPYSQVPAQYNPHQQQQPTSTFLSNTLIPSQPKPPAIAQQVSTQVIDPTMILNDFKKRMSKGKKVALWLIFAIIVLCGIIFFVFWLIEYLGVTDLFWHPFFDPPAPK